MATPRLLSELAAVAERLTVWSMDHIHALESSGVSAKNEDSWVHPVSSIIECVGLRICL